MKNKYSKLIAALGFKTILSSLFLLLTSSVLSQNILVDGASVLVSGETQFPFWLRTGQTLAVGANVISISVIEYNLSASSFGGNDLSLEQVIKVTAVQPVPANKVWKVESALLNLAASVTGWVDDGSVVRLATDADNLGVGTTSPAASAKVDITSTTKGFLPPRMTTTQRNLISLPEDGLVIFNITTGCLNYCFSLIWRNLCGSSGSNTIVATGGAITFAGGFTIHTFTSSGTFTLTSGSGNVEVLVVAGGGGGGSGNVPGGGGAGGVIYNSALALSSSINVTVGAGGLGQGQNQNGANSVFGTLIAIGGGSGGNEQEAGLGSGKAGGSGGGASYSPGGTDYTNLGGVAQQPSSPSGGFGNPGGRGSRQVNTHCNAGGGGAGGPGEDGVFNQIRGGAGGIGRVYTISGTLLYYGGGGGGSTWSGGTATSAGGLGGGGIGGFHAVSQGALANGAANTGGGGGAGYTGSVSGSGGSGIVIVRYPTP